MILLYQSFVALQLIKRVLETFVLILMFLLVFIELFWMVPLFIIFLLQELKEIEIPIGLWIAFEIYAYNFTIPSLNHLLSPFLFIFLSPISPLILQNWPWVMPFYFLYFIHTLLNLFPYKCMLLFLRSKH